MAEISMGQYKDGTEIEYEVSEKTDRYKLNEIFSQMKWVDALSSSISFSLLSNLESKEKTGAVIAKNRKSIKMIEDFLKENIRIVVANNYDPGVISEINFNMSLIMATCEELGINLHL